MTAGVAAQPEAAPLADDPALPIAVELVAQFEGYRSVPYQDQAGVWTIGYGTTRISGEPVTALTPTVSKAQAHDLMMAELAPLCGAVRAIGPQDARDNQVAACTSFAYNEGLAALRGSTLARFWVLGNLPDAAAQFDEWVFIHNPETHQLERNKGLQNRRAVEKAVFLGKTA